MKKIAIMAVVATAVLMMGSCGGKTQQVPFDNGDSADIFNQDPTVYGVCGDETSMHSLQIITDTGDTLLLDLQKAEENGMVLGGLHAGDRMAVMPNEDKTAALQVVNQTALLGNWVMPNPLDGSDEVGICIKEGGIAESIEQSSIIYKTWRLTFGKLELVLVREGGAGDDETYLYDITKLGPDSLTFKDADDTFEYSRQKPKELYGTDIELEGVSEDDMKI